LRAKRSCGHPNPAWPNGKRRAFASLPRLWRPPDASSIGPAPLAAAVVVHGCYQGGSRQYVNMGGKRMRPLTILASIPFALVSLTSLQAQEVLTGEAAFGTAENDAPGVRRHITPADLPPPSHHENDPEAP